MNKIKFKILGNPIPQQRHRMGRGYSYDPCSKLKTKTKLELQKQMKKKFIHTGSVDMWITFFMKRPKSHYRSGKYHMYLKKDSPFNHIKKPDIDNLLKYIMDCCNGIVYKDDSQVRFINAKKVYCDVNGVADPQTHIEFLIKRGQ